MACLDIHKVRIIACLKVLVIILLHMEGNCWVTERGGESVIDQFNLFLPYNPSVISM
jgi:hypothetical protein